MNYTHLDQQTDPRDPWEKAVQVLAFAALLLVIALSLKQ